MIDPASTIRLQRAHRNELLNHSAVAFFAVLAAVFAVAWAITREQLKREMAAPKGPVYHFELTPIPTPEDPNVYDILIEESQKGRS